MAYNNTYMPYPNPYYPQMFQPQPQNQQDTQNNNIIWVSGEAGAKSYMVAPNTTVQLWDSEQQTIYLKSADASGMPSMKVLDYKIRNSEQTTPQLSQATDNYVTLSEFNGLKDELTRVKNELAKLSNREVSHDESKRDE